MLLHVTRLRGADDSYHTVTFSSSPDDLVHAVIAEQVAHYRRLGAPFEWKVYAHDRPADLRERLSRAGFVVGPTEAVLVLDLRRPPDWVTQGSQQEVVRVERPEQVELFRDAAEEFFGKDYGLTAGQLLAGIAAGSTQHVGYVAMEAGVAVSIGRLYTHPDSHFGGLYGGGTRAASRGRGLYRARRPGARRRPARGEMPRRRRPADQPADPRTPRVRSPDGHVAVRVEARAPGGLKFTIRSALAGKVPVPITRAHRTARRRRARFRPGPGSCRRRPPAREGAGGSCRKRRVRWPRQCTRWCRCRRRR